MVMIRSIKFKFFGFILGAFVIYFLQFHSFFGTQDNKQYQVDLQYVVVHLDLKGAPPKLSYLEDVLKLLKDYGVNGILMEYEDMFPYQHNLVNLSSKYSYDRKELKNFLLTASYLQIEIIPLIQTFGHMEHVLKLAEFDHLREDVLFPDSICPSNKESVNLIRDMLKQVIIFHSNIVPLKHIHIGCDEVYNINKCVQCRQKKSENADIFIEHVKTITEIVHTISPLTKVLIWDDMLGKIPKTQWNTRTMMNLNFEPVLWDYTPNLGDPNLNLYYYHRKFQDIWIASAFKGADGREALFPDLQNRFRNHFSWMNFILNYKFAGERKVYNFKGIVLTGWSRYSHMDPLCDLLPASIPSLILNLLVVRKFQAGVNLFGENKQPEEFFTKEIALDLNKHLRCEDTTDYIETFDLTYYSCTFEGNSLYKYLKQYEYLKKNIDHAFSDDKSDIEFKVKHNTMNLYNAEKSKTWCEKTLNEIFDWENKMSIVMTKYYDEYIITEFVQSKTATIKKNIKAIQVLLEDYLGIRSWKRRL